MAEYLAAHGVGMTGTFFKFGKDGFVTTSDETTIPEGTQFICIYDQVVGGWIKFMGKGNPPIRKQGRLFEGFVPIPRSELGDNDREEWELGLSGQPQDPWQIQLLLPLQNVETGELFVFQTTSVTGQARCGQPDPAMCADAKEGPGPLSSRQAAHRRLRAPRRARRLGKDTGI